MSLVSLVHFLKMGGKCPGCHYTSFCPGGYCMQEDSIQGGKYQGGYFMWENFVLGGKRLGELNKNAGGFCSGRKMSWEDRKNN